MEVGSINYIDINEEMRSSYLDYAMSVIVARALPDARDGLKPVHRRILYAMHDMGIRANSPHRKSARIVGEVLGKYHPHGDSSVYEAMVRMAQDFSLRYPLVDGQGNFGSIDGDRAAAMRYTEARLAKITSIVMEDIDKNTVEFEDNFDGAEREPTVLPAELPNLLLNGTSGIAVGMSTNIPPHNLTEVCNALVYMIDNQDKYDDISVDNLMEFITAPDFPTGGQIVGTTGVKSAYATGRGRVVMRGVATVEDMPGKKNRQRINITEIPYQVNKSSLIERIAELANKGVLTDVSDLRDESDRNGMSIIVEIKQGRQPMKVLNQLYKHTTLQSTFGVQMLALVDRQPKMLPLKRALQIYIDHRTEIKTRSTQFDLDKALARHHILEGLLIAINNLDAVIKTIRESPSADAARTNLMNGFDLSEKQAQAILDMQLRRLAALERQKIEDEFTEISKTIAYLQDLLDNKHKILDLIKDEVFALIEKYGDERRTEIVQGDGEFFDEDMIQDKDVLVSISRRGYMKRTPVAAYRLQSRGGKGLIGAGTKDEDELEHLFMAGSLNTLLCFTNQGKVYAIKTYEIPELDRTAKGTSVMNILPLTPEEKVTVVLPVPNFDDAEYLTMITNFGRIKRVALSAFKKVRANGLIALNLDDGDSLNWVKMTAGNEDLLLVSENGQGIRFSEEDVRPMGRTAAGVNAMKLSDGDTLAGADIASEDDFLLVITEKGMGKRTQVSEFRRQNRYGGGMRAMVLKKAGDKVVASRVVSPGDQVTCISSNGIILRTRVDEISQQGRATQGVRVMDLREDDIVASVAVVRPRLIEENSTEVDADGNPVPVAEAETEGVTPVVEGEEEVVDVIEAEEAAPEESDGDAEA